MKLRKHLLAGLAFAFLASTAQAETLRWGSPRDIFSLDPYSYGSTSNLAFLNHVYEGLTRYTPDFVVEPALATKWELVSEKVWRFKLRKGVKFQNGADFTADDVMASLARVSHPTSPLKGNIPAYRSTTKVDDYTVDIEVNAPSPLLLNDMTNIFMFDKEWLIENKTELPTDVGAKVEGYTTYQHQRHRAVHASKVARADSKTVFVENQRAGGTPRSTISTASNSRRSPRPRLASRRCCRARSTSPTSRRVQDLPRLKRDPNIKILQRTDLRTIFLAFNRKDKLVDGRENPFNDIKVRQAIDHAIDRRADPQAASCAASRATPAPWWRRRSRATAPNSTCRPPIDPDKAKKLLAEAGYADGFEFTLRLHERPKRQRRGGLPGDRCRCGRASG